MGIRNVARLLALAVAGLVAASCAETQLAVYTAKKGLSRDTAQASAPERSVPAGYKLGSNYKVLGVVYQPRFDPNYDETGIASWYGAEFHGRSTANGERFDMNAVSAAHKTLPLPSEVRVTNLDNGRTMTLRVNDRGPFARGRLIDVSRRAAQLLGFYGVGTAKVRVQFVRLAPLTQMANAAEASPVTASLRVDETFAAKSADGTEVGPLARLAVTTEPLAPPPTLASTGDGGWLAAEAAEPPASIAATDSAHDMFIQVGAFEMRDNALRLGARLAPLGRTVIQPLKRGGRTLHRVRIGPLASLRDADAMLDRVIGAGYTDARLVVD